MESMSSGTTPRAEVHDERTVHRKTRFILESSCHRRYLLGPVRYVGSASHVTGEVQRSRAEVRVKFRDYSGNAE